MRPDDRTRIRHLREAATKAVTYGADKQRSDLDDDELLRLALTKLVEIVEIVGEAAKGVTAEGRADMPEVPWRAAGRMRDRLVHHYFDVNLDILWRTITEDLPQLIAALPPEYEHDRPGTPPTAPVVRDELGDEP